MNLCAYVTKDFFQITFYWNTGVTIRFDVAPEVRHNNFVSVYKQSYINF